MVEEEGKFILKISDSGLFFAFGVEICEKWGASLDVFESRTRSVRAASFQQRRRFRRTGLATSAGLCGFQYINLCGGILSRLNMVPNVQFGLKSSSKSFDSLRFHQETLNCCFLSFIDADADGRTFSRLEPLSVDLNRFPFYNMQISEHLIANKRSQVGRFHNSQEIEGSSPFLEAVLCSLTTALSDCTELKKTENLCRRNGSINWAQKLVAPAEVPAVQEPEHSPHRQSAQLEAPVTPVSNLARERKFFEEDETGKFDDEVKYLKSCGTLLRTPSEIRNASERQSTLSEDEKSRNSEWHSWFPPPPVKKINWDGQPAQAPTPPAHLHEVLSGIPTPNLPPHIPKQLSERFTNEMSQNRDAMRNKQDALHYGGRERKRDGDDSISVSGVSSSVSEDEGNLNRVSPDSTKIRLPPVQRPPRYEQYLSAEEDSDSFSDTGSFASIDSAAKNENSRLKQFDSPARIDPQTPPLFKSNYSPQPTPLKLSDDMHTPWTGCPTTLENAGVNKNARIRSQYVYSVLNPVENLSQWKALKRGKSKEFELKNKAWAEGSEMTENQSLTGLQTQLSPTNKQRLGTKGAVADSGLPKFPRSYSISRTDSMTKENFPGNEEMKLVQDNFDVIDESSQKRKLVATSPEPIFKTPKSAGQFNLLPVEAPRTPPSGMLNVDSSLSHWLKSPVIVEDGNAGQVTLMQKIQESDVYQHETSVESQNSLAATLHKSSPLRVPSPTSSGVSQMRNSPGKNLDEKPILGALSIKHLQSISPGKSPSTKSGDDDRPILGTVAAHWNDIQSASPKWWDGKGIPNSTNKYKEDQKVSWHTTPFEERLEKALSNESVVFQRKVFNGKPINFEECEESDTAAS
eukprot:Gb_38139 [translate_table: standard]